MWAAGLEKTSAESQSSAAAFEREDKMHARKTVVAVATAIFVLVGQMPATAQEEVECPADVSGNECEYYKDGFMAGAEDGKSSMSMAYERHADSYDSRFEPYFKAGYEAGWTANR